MLLEGDEDVETDGKRQGDKDREKAHGWLIKNPARGGLDYSWELARIHATLMARFSVRILFDFTDLIHWTVHNKSFTGIQRVQVETYVAMLARGLAPTAVYFCETTRRYLKVDADKLLLPDQAYAASLIFHLKTRVGREVYRRIGQRYRAIHIMAGDIVFVSGMGWAPRRRTDYVLGVQRSGVARVVWMLYDVIPITHPEYTTPEGVREFSHWIKEAIKFPCDFVCISEYSRNELLKFAHQRSANVTAITVPLAHQFTSDAVGLRPQYSFLSRRNFVLSVGTVDVRKNHIDLAQIWHRLYLERGPANLPLLVICGRPGWNGGRLHNFLQGTGYLYGHLIHDFDAEDEELAWLYENCQFTVFPSLYEGWGLPIGESLWFSKSVVCYDHSSHREVGGESAIYASNQAEMESIVRGLLDAPQGHAKMKHHLRLWSDVGSDIANYIAPASLRILPASCG